MTTTVQDVPKYSGADWLEANLQCYPKFKGKTLSPLARKVADILGQVYAGLYHLPGITKQKWFEPWGVEVRLSSGQEVATFDGSELSLLVVLCHDAAIRLSISAGREPWKLKGYEHETALEMYQHIRDFHDADLARAMCSEPCLVLQFHQRKHGEGRTWERHPTMEHNVERARRLGSAIAKATGGEG